MRLHQTFVSHRIHLREIKMAVHQELSPMNNQAASKTHQEHRATIHGPPGQPAPAGAVSVFCFCDSDGSDLLVVAANNNIPALVQLLKSSSPEAQEAAAMALQSLAASGSNRAAMRAAGAVPLLASLLTSPRTHVQWAAAAAVAELCRDSAGKAAIVAAGSVPALAGLLDCGNDSDDSSGYDDCHPGHLAVHTLLDLTSSASASVRAAVLQADCVPALVRLLNRCSDYVLSMAAAAGVLRNLITLLGASSADAIVAAGAVAPLLSMLSSSSTCTQLAAAEMLLCLVERGSCKAEIVAAGAIPPFVELLKSSDSRVKSAAAAALSQCLSDDTPWGAMLQQILN